MQILVCTVHTLQQTVDFHRYSSWDGCHAPVVVQRQVPWLAENCGVPQLQCLWPLSSSWTSCCARWCNDCGSRNAWFDYGYMFCIIQGGFWKNLYDFLHEGVDSAPEVDSPSWSARRRHWQWHVPYWFCWFDAPRAMFPRLPAVCRLMLQLLSSCTWKSVHYFYEPPVFSAFSTVKNFALVDFLEPSSTHRCECSRAGGWR